MIDRDVASLRDKQGEPLDPSRRYRLAAGGSKQWKIKRANHDGTVDLASTQPGSSLLPRANVDPAKLTRIRYDHEYPLLTRVPEPRTPKFPTIPSIGPIPHLQGAACKGLPHLFDRGFYDPYVEAKRLCAACPALAACHQWAEATDEPLVGFIAGKPRSPDTEANAARKKRQR